MRKTLAVLALLALGGAAAAFTRPGPGHRQLKLDIVSSTRPLLAVQPTRESAYLVRVNPRTLRPVRGRRLMVAGHSFGSSFSPDGRLVALGDDGGGEIWLVDTRRLRIVRRIDTGSYGFVAATAWLGGRLIAVVDRCCYEGPSEGLTVAILDPASRRVIGSRSLDASLQAIQRTASKLVLLLGPRGEIGGSTIATIDSEGRVATASLARIMSGSEFRDGQPFGRAATPGLALDRAGNRAFAVGAGAPVAEIDLGTLHVAYHELSTPVSLLGKVRDWLEPVASAKQMPEGPMRRAAWLDGFLVVSGHDSHAWLDAQGKTQMRETAAGVRIIDTRSWSVRTLDAEASDVTLAGESLLVSAALWDSTIEATRGIGLTAYSSNGARVFHVLGSKPVSVQVVGSRAFAPSWQGARSMYTIVDLRSGRVLRTILGRMPEVLSG